MGDRPLDQGSLKDMDWAIRISVGAYDASGHVPAVDDDFRFKNPY